MQTLEQEPRSTDTLGLHLDAALLDPCADHARAVAFARRAEEVGARNVVLFPRHLFAAIEAGFSRPATVISFPHGADATEMKLVACEAALNLGARELDVVCDLAALAASQWQSAERELALIRDLVGDVAVIKATIETPNLTDRQIAEAAKVVEWTGCEYIKTSSGRSRRGVTLADVHILRSAIEGATQIKAAGRIRSAAFARDLLIAGADIVEATDLNHIFAGS